MAEKYSHIDEQHGFTSKVYQKVLKDEIKYHQRIEHIIVDTKYDALVKHMLCGESQVLSFLNYKRPMLYECGKHKFYNAFKFWVSSCQHFSDKLGSFVNDVKLALEPPSSQMKPNIQDNEQKSNDDDRKDFLREYFTLAASKTISSTDFVCFIYVALVYIQLYTFLMRAVYQVVKELKY